DREQDREDRRIAAEQARADRAAEVEHQRQVERDRAREQSRIERERQAQRQQRAQDRAQRRARMRQYLGAHAVDLLIYPIALVSLALAAPAMASYGTEVYGPVLGWLLPGITELGMWCMAVAVQVSRHRHPERPV